MGCAVDSAKIEFGDFISLFERDAMSENTNPTLNDAIAAARAGRRDDAARILRQVVANEPFNAEAWVWLGGVTSDVREQRRALEQALAIDPGNQRAQQGLGWLRHSQPEVFEGGATGATVTRPRSERSTPNYEQSVATRGAGTDAGKTVVFTDEPRTENRGAAIYPAPPEAQPRVYDAPTQAMPAAPPYVQQPAPQYPPAPQYTPRQAPQAAPPQYPQQPASTDRMAAAPGSAPYQDAQRGYVPQPYSDAGHTDRMAAVPPPVATHDHHAAHYDNKGNLSRWLLVLIWLFGFGAVATLAAAIIVDPNRFEPTLRPFLSAFGLQLVQSDLRTTGFITTLALIALAVYDFIIALGLMFRGRWAWVFNLLTALLVTAGLIGLIVVYALVTLPALGFQPTSLALFLLAGLIIFTLIYLILSFASRRAFFRRRVA